MLTSRSFASTPTTSVQAASWRFASPHWIALAASLLISGCKKEGAPDSAPGAQAGAASAPVSAPAAAEPSACERVIDHVAKLVEDSPKLPADRKAAMKAAATEPSKRTAAIDSCEQQPPPFAECTLKATDLAGVVACSPARPVPAAAPRVDLPPMKGLGDELGSAMDGVPAFPAFCHSRTWADMVACDDWMVKNGHAAGGGE